jgi:hypothetical protein
MLHGAIYKIVALDHCESGKGWARDNLNKIEAVTELDRVPDG